MKKIIAWIKDSNRIKHLGCGTPIIATIPLAIILCLTSCATKKKIEYVDREVVKYQAIVRHDTLFQHTRDSVYHTVFQKGDTVYDTKYVEKTKWRDRVMVVTDTLYRDSIQTQIKETTKEIIKIPKWCYYSLVVCVLFIIFAFTKLVRWLQII